MNTPPTDTFQEMLEMQEDVVPPPPAVHTLEMCSPTENFVDEAASLMSANSMLAHSLLGRSSAKRKEAAILRRKREFTPDEKKDDGYWDKRKKNNEAAKRSREKRRVNDVVLENRVIALLEENARLKAELLALKFRFGLVKDPAEPPSPAPRFSSAVPSGYHTRMDASFAGPICDGREVAMSRPAFGRLAPPQEPPGYSEDSGFSTPGSSSIGSPVFFDERTNDQEKFSPRQEEAACFDGTLCHGIDSDREGGRASPSDPGRCPRYEVPDTVKCLPHKLRFKMCTGAEEVELDSRPPRDNVVVMASPPQTDSAPPKTSYPILQAGPSSHSSTSRGPSLAWRPHGTVGSHEDQRGHPPFLCSEETPKFVGQGGPSYPYANPLPVHPDSTGYHESENNVLKNQLASLSAEVAQLKKLFSEQILIKMN
ncbi:nuclear factor interleukin-3-regulated protein-like [Ambystoma mexicanum]|uniref:nuclear factor interleukin-3-regulated protein-like n=1 Tax=Ambystoma mexicanum TaxID=8296 RepID=UPI0037E846B4